MVGAVLPVPEPPVPEPPVPELPVPDSGESAVGTGSPLGVRQPPKSIITTRVVPSLARVLDLTFFIHINLFAPGSGTNESEGRLVSNGANEYFVVAPFESPVLEGVNDKNCQLMMRDQAPDTS